MGLDAPRARGAVDVTSDLSGVHRDRGACALSPNDAEAWPPLMTTRVATAYCGFKTTGALRKAYLEGKITPHGRRGGIGTLMWRRKDLDQFLAGKGANLDLGRSGAPREG